MKKFIISGVATQNAKNKKNNDINLRGGLN